jgi:ssDNA-binding Zn-finger/Zn-ribbon topoisomerase 1
MAYYRKSSDTIGILISNAFFGYIIYKIFGWTGLAVAIASIFGIIIVIAQYHRYKNRKEEEERANVPCAHGIPGALYGYKVCLKCQQDKIAKEQMAKRRAEEEEARRKAEKEQAYKEWVSKIKLPEYLISMNPEEFEHLVCDLFRKMGYEVKPTQYSGDSGVDGYLKKDGVLSILQCKRVKGSVGEPILRDLFGTMHAEGAKEGVVVTTGRVSIQARAWLKDKPIRILELDEVVNHIRMLYREEDIVPETFAPHKSGNDFCPKCGNPLKVVKWKGKSFMGCSAYPSCRYTTRLHKKRYLGA